MEQVLIVFVVTQLHKMMHQVLDKLEEIKQSTVQKRSRSSNHGDGGTPTARRRLIDSDSLTSTADVDTPHTSPYVEGGSVQPSAQRTPPRTDTSAVQKSTDVFAFMLRQSRDTGATLQASAFEKLMSMSLNVFLKECVIRNVDIGRTYPFGNQEYRSYTQRGKQILTAAKTYLQGDGERHLFDPHNNPAPTHTQYMSWLTELSELALKVTDRMVEDLIPKYNNIRGVHKKNKNQFKSRVSVSMIYNVLS